MKEVRNSPGYRLDTHPDHVRFFFQLITLNCKNKEDLPSILRYRLASTLPHGISGVEFFYKQIKGTNRVFITLLRSPLPQDFNAQKIFLPFDLCLTSKLDTIIRWQGTAFVGDYLVSYEKGKAKSIEVVPHTPTLSIKGENKSLNRTAIMGPPIQESPPVGKKVWQLLAVAMGMILLAQVLFLSFSELNTRANTLRNLEEQISILEQKMRLVGAGTKAADPSSLLLSKALTALETSWLDGFFLSRLALRDTQLHIEGWGPNALNLLGSLKMNSIFHKLNLQSIKTTGALDAFVFSGELAKHDT